MSHTTICPKCHLKSQVDESLIGRFITCDQCRCLYYVVVPPLGEERTEWQSVPATSAVFPHDSASPPSSFPSAETESLRLRLRRLTVLVVVNLLIGLAVLLLEVIRWRS